MLYFRSSFVEDVKVWPYILQHVFRESFIYTKYKFRIKCIEFVILDGLSVNILYYYENNLLNIF